MLVWEHNFNSHNIRTLIHLQKSIISRSSNPSFKVYASKGGESKTRHFLYIRVCRFKSPRSVSFFKSSVSSLYKVYIYLIDCVHDLSGVISGTGLQKSWLRSCFTSLTGTFVLWIGLFHHWTQARIIHKQHIAYIHTSHNATETDTFTHVGITGV